jgi:hypothetical protein
VPSAQPYGVPLVWLGVSVRAGGDTRETELGASPLPFEEIRSAALTPFDVAPQASGQREPLRSFSTRTGSQQHPGLQGRGRGEPRDLKDLLLVEGLPRQQRLSERVELLAVRA